MPAPCCLEAGTAVLQGTVSGLVLMCLSEDHVLLLIRRGFLERLSLRR